MLRTRRSQVLNSMDLVETVENWPTALTVEQLAELMAVSPKTIYKAIRKGKLRAARLGSLLRLNPQTTADWLRTFFG